MAKLNNFLSSDAYKKLEFYLSSKSSKPLHQVSRSINPKYNKIDKLDDVTRYNSANYNVNLYQNYPNRCGTPIKSSRKHHKPGYKFDISPKVRLVRDLFDESFSISPEKKKELFIKAVEAPLRASSAQPKILCHKGGAGRAVMNDFHIRETNPGFARNALGGYYTR
ncbi:unnamed protein product [Blepharisma stoltei]|uniref:Uncharacterized protein n=1 Tax=Blepharisma stoltei TaxID=1481888 RepID=A0AAU9KCZ1_9CILI|nr:unnamed protein product [Blepharisma stoltei]